MPVNERHQESGFTMIATVLAMSVVVMLAAVAMAAVNSDTHLTRRDLDGKQAFEAAKAGIDDYAYHLSSNTGYWAECTGVATPNAVNQKGSTAKRRAVPGTTGATYAIELIPATGQTTCNPSTIQTATTSMIETGETLPGSFRIRSTGFSGQAKESIVATFKPPSFLDYVYFTQLETLDPVTYGFPNPSEELTKAYEQCALTWQEGRYDDWIRKYYVTNWRGEQEAKYEYCVKISFGEGDKIFGPVHTNDAIAINGHPTLGRTSKDMIEVGAKEPGWYPISYGDEPNFVGQFVMKAPKLIPPASNSQLSTIAQSSFKYTGQVRICLNGTNMTVGNGSSCTGVYSGAIPSNGVVYVANSTSTSCSEVYSPFTAVYPTTSPYCGNVYVHTTGSGYSGQLTIAAQNNIIIDGDLSRASGSNGMLGLIANNFVRFYHPYCPSVSGTPTCTTTTAQSKVGDCDGENGAGSLEGPDIDAAILAIEHSIIVDHYDCGASLGDLNIEGALAQKYRGPVGTQGGTGFKKNYVYDDRLHYQEPPSFIDPKPSQWVIGRETIE
jgi:type II secretory pathway pseudopilin PulG